MRIELNGDTALVRARTTPRLLAILPQLEGRRRWLKAGGLSIEASARNLEIITGAFPEAVVESAGAPAPGPSLQPHGVAAYEPRTRPYPHQIVALERARSQPAFALFMEQGTGKTKVAIDRAGELYSDGKITGVLVCAKKGVHRQWIESQLPEHMGCEWTGHCWEASKLRPASSRGRGGLEWMSINFDGIKTPRGEAACLEFVRRHEGKLLIIADETQEIKNARSARHKAMQKLKQAARSPYRLALTGTPIAKDLVDEWAQLKWLNEDILGMRYIRSFMNEYCILGGFEGRVVIGHKNLERFRARVDPHTFRATKDELGILPKAYRRWSFELSQAQRRAIDEIKQDLRYRLMTGEICTVQGATVAMLKVQQVSNGFFIGDSGEMHNVIAPDRNPRLNALVECIEAYGGKTIVWARFREDIRLISERLRKAGISVVEYHGGTKDAERSSAVESFLDPDGARIFLSNPQAGGTGLNLQGGCNHAIYYSNSFNAIDRWQSEDRIHRIGTNGAVVYTDIVCSYALDKYILSNIKRKKGNSELALGDIARWAEGEEEL